MMTAEDYDDMNNLNLFIRFFHFFDCSKQASILVRNKIFLFCEKHFKAAAV